MSESESMPATVRQGIFRDTSPHVVQSLRTVLIEWGEEAINSQSVLSFVQTAPDRPHCLVLTITQKGSDTPVTLTTDAPDYFQFAADSRPLFLPALTITPSARGTYVHVRYLASRNDSHTGQLMIQTGHETMMVRLEGRKTGRLPAIRKRLPVIRQAVVPDQPQPGVFTNKLWLLIALAIVFCLGYAAFAGLRLFVPAPHRPAETGLVKKQNRASVLSGPATVSARDAKRKAPTVGKKERKTALPARLRASHAAHPTPAAPTEKRENDQSVQPREIRPASQAPVANEAVIPQGTVDKTNKKQHQPAVSDTTTSELEQLLNQPK